MRITKHNAPVHFQGANIQKVDEYIRRYALGKKTNEAIDKTVKKLSATADEFKREVVVNFDTPFNMKNVCRISATDKESDFLLGQAILSCEKDPKILPKIKEENGEVLGKFLSKATRSLEEFFSSGRDIKGKPVLDKWVSKL